MAAIGIGTVELDVDRDLLLDHEDLATDTDHRFPLDLARPPRSFDADVAHGTSTAAPRIFPAAKRSRASSA